MTRWAVWTPFVLPGKAQLLLSAEILQIVKPFTLKVLKDHFVHN